MQSFQTFYVRHGYVAQGGWMPVTKVLVTGAYGLIGGIVYSHLQAQAERYEVYALARRRYPSERFPTDKELYVPDGRFTLSDLSDLGVLEGAVQGIDFYVVSENKFCWVDLDHSWEGLGYVPQDSADDRLQEGTI
jgi:hypothetical protein